MKKKFLLVLVAVIMLMTISVFAIQETDIRIVNLKNSKILIGDEKGNLNLNETLKRQEMVVLISRLMGKEEEAKNWNTDSLTFEDVNKNDWAAGYIAWAKDNNITKGYSDECFGYNDSLTTTQTQIFLLRVLRYNAEIDVNSIELAHRIGMMYRVFGTDVNILREHVAIMLYNTLFNCKIKDTEITLAEELGIIPEDSIAKYVEVGDYIEYIPDESTESYTITNGYSGEIFYDVNGDGSVNELDNQTIYKQNINWRVLENDGTNVILISENPVDEICLGGLEIYNDDAEVLNRMYKDLYSGSKGVGRNLNIYDVNETLKFVDEDKEAWTYYYYYGNIKPVPEGIETMRDLEEKLGMNTLGANLGFNKAKPNYYQYQIGYREEIKYELIFGKIPENSDTGMRNIEPYWLSSTCAAFSQQPHGYRYYLRTIENHRTVSARTVATYYGQKEFYGSTLAGRPVVNIKLDVIVDKQNSGDGKTPETAWKLTKEKNNNLKLGDYVKYIPDNNNSNYIVNSYESGTDNNQTIYKENINWRVLKNDGKNIVLISENPLSEIILKGAKGYNNGANILNNVCNSLYSGSNGNARSINKEDIDEIMKHYEYWKDEEEQTIGEIYEELSYNKTPEPNKKIEDYVINYYGYSFEESNRIQEKLINLKENEEGYWIANNCVGFGEHSDDLIIFGMHSVLRVYDDYQEEDYIASWVNKDSMMLFDNYGNEYGCSLPIRPIVILNSDVVIEESSGNGVTPETAWKLK